LSFFDDDEDEPPAPPSGGAARGRPRPSPRRPQRAVGAGGVDQHTLMVRRRVAAVAGIVLLIIVVLVINSCRASAKKQGLEDYNQNVSQLVQASDQQVSHPLFEALVNASSKQPLEVENQINQLRLTAQKQVSTAQGLSVPGDMEGAQRDLLLALDLRAEGLTKVDNLVRTALGGQNKQASTLIAGDMEMFLASDVIYSERVAPLIQQTLVADGIHEQNTAASRFLPNVGWLDPETALQRLTGQTSSGSSSSGPIAPGTHGHSITGVSVGSTNLAPSPELNHISGGGSPTFTVMVLNGGENPETNVKVEVSVTAGGKTVKGSHVIDKTEPGKTVSVDIPVTGITPGAAARITAYVLPVPGETNIENNKATYLAVFGE
jgi:hypothetical protein